MSRSNSLILFVLACSTTILGAQTASAKSTVPPNTSAGHLARQKPVPVSLEYRLFIAEKARDHESLQQAMRENPDRFPPDIEVRDMSLHIGITPEEYATILAHILDANDRLKQNEREWRAALYKFQNSPDYSVKSVPPPELIALGKEHEAILNGTIQSLKHELGRMSFHKLNTWVDLNYWAETSVPAPGTEPRRPRQVIDPATQQAPAVLT